ncbi:hypothetical protein CTI12_AA463060 [Artemisia annua]|uniref:Uncharacterized protein n=1 Tax=Artemisia annua TaxID=35608 RepID=A0A2U1LQR2_ARTAN|nr:hypothetical protein CTI12_AA463060 [Artemisia annua]
MENGSHGGYDGGHIGSGGGGFSNYINSWYKPVPPPLTAIDRFLWGRTQNDQTQSQNQKTNEPFVSLNGVPEFSCHSNGINNESGICLASYLPMTKNFMADDDGDLFINNIGECLSLDELRSYPNYAQNRESNQVIKPEKVFANSVKKVKGGAISKVLIKGQWTEEEDSKLIRLVKHYGEQKWALIAEKMAGRAGKQCRERWRNHLRPDIKVFDRDFQLFAFRKMNGVKKSTTTITTVNSTVIPELSNLSNNNSDPSLEITQTNDDELDFMQTFFQTTNSSETSSHVIEPKSPTINCQLGFSSFSSTLNDENSNVYFNNYPEEDSSKAHIALDSNHLEGNIAMPSSKYQGCHGDGSSSSAKKTWIWSISVSI